jgi:hypothetical protein
MVIEPTSRSLEGATDVAGGTLVGDNLIDAVDSHWLLRRCYMTVFRLCAEKMLYDTGDTEGAKKVSIPKRLSLPMCREMDRSKSEDWSYYSTFK